MQSCGRIEDSHVLPALPQVPTCPFLVELDIEPLPVLWRFDYQVVMD